MPARPRRSVMDGLGKGLARRPAVTESPAEDLPAVEVATATEQAATAKPAAKTQRKFTVLLDVADADAFTRLTTRIQEQLPERLVRKSDVIRALVALAGDDATLREQVTAELRAETG